jgi:ABC-type cobalamin transport system ATPase subunit
LANIYVQQACYSKALEAYRYLSLKYPEKRRTFAIQIEKVNNLIEQQIK